MPNSDEFLFEIYLLCQESGVAQIRSVATALVRKELQRKHEGSGGSAFSLVARYKNHEKMKAAIALLKKLIEPYKYLGIANEPYQPHLYPFEIAVREFLRVALSRDYGADSVREFNCAEEVPPNQNSLVLSLAKTLGVSSQNLQSVLSREHFISTYWAAARPVLPASAEATFLTAHGYPVVGTYSYVRMAPSSSVKEDARPPLLVLRLCIQSVPVGIRIINILTGATRDLALVAEHLSDACLTLGHVKDNAWVATSLKEALALKNHLNLPCVIPLDMASAWKAQFPKVSLWLHSEPPLKT